MYQINVLKSDSEDIKGKKKFIQSLQTVRDSSFISEINLWNIDIPVCAHIAFTQ